MRTSYDLLILIFSIVINAVTCDAFVNTQQSIKTLKPISNNEKNKSFLKFHKKVLKGSEESASIVGAAKPPVTIDPRTLPPYAFSKQQYLYVVLTSIFVTCLIVADVIGVKLFEFKLPFPILGHKTVEHTCGMLTFPITFLLGDIINEYYVIFI